MTSGTIVSLDDSAQACRRDRRLARRVQPSVLTCVGRASKQPFQFVAGLVTPGVRQPLQFAQVTRMDRAWRTRTWQITPRASWVKPVRR
jgi:hypothetical protein